MIHLFSTIDDQAHCLRAFVVFLGVALFFLLTW
jgi:hypothetical protein